MYNLSFFPFFKLFFPTVIKVLKTAMVFFFGNCFFLQKVVTFLLPILEEIDGVFCHCGKTPVQQEWAFENLDL